MSAGDVKKWRQRRESDRKQWITIIRERERRGPAQRIDARKKLIELIEREYSDIDPAIVSMLEKIKADPRYGGGERQGWRYIYVDADGKNNVDDVVIQLLAYLLQDEFLSWDVVMPWVKRYYAPFGRGYDDGEIVERIGNFSNPFDANGLRPSAQFTSSEEYLSIPQVARELGITERQLRYMLSHDKMQIHGAIRKKRGAVAQLRIPRVEVERLQDDPAVKLAVKRKASRRRRGTEVGALEELIAELGAFRPLASPGDEWDRVTDKLQELYRQRDGDDG